ncbi:hypothetical protein Hsero_2155 [Herbaspirillum seropedicae SmR1]|uniref:Transmembrane protein n=1 Tax=Herbaspirillum seropedicae (strain SmR1) TaxID=757424 RepID=D8IT95_HERSS|nr:hypothetical protein Hsero_2155 [Herbaspirillum seropedicae SmR1]
MADFVDLAAQFAPLVCAEFTVAALFLVAGHLVAVILRVEVARVLPEVTRLARHRTSTLGWARHRGSSHAERHHRGQT